MKDLYQQVLFYTGALWRRRWLVFGIACLVMAVGWVGVASMPDIYKSSARIYVDTGNVLRPLLAGVAVEDDVNRQVEIMRRTLLSRPNMTQLARMTDQDITVESPEQMEALIEDLQNRIEIDAGQDNLFMISFSNRSPRLARDVVQSLTTLFVENNLGQNRADIDNAQEFLNRQISDYEAKLNNAESALARFQQENAEFLPGQSGLQKSLADARKVLLDVRGAWSDAQAKQRLLEEELANTPRMLGQAGYGAGPPTDVDARIVALQASLEDLRARYTDQHPDVATLKRRLDNMLKEKEAQQAAFGGDGPGATENMSGIPNPVYSDLRLSLVTERTNVEILKEQVQRAQSVVTNLEQRIFLVPEVEAQLKALTRDYEVIKSNYETLLGRRESARISADREQEGNRVNFRIIEAASIPLRPDGPNRGLFMILVTIVSVGAGCGMAWLMAVTRVTYGSVDHLRRDFNIPVIGALSVVGGDIDDKRRRHDNVRLMAACGVVLAVFVSLLFLESRYGLQSVKFMSYSLSMIVFALGAATLALEYFAVSLFGKKRSLTMFNRALEGA